MRATFTVFYTCLECGLKDTSCHTIARTLGEDIKTWMDQTLWAVKNDHTKKSPRCQARTVDLKIPIESEKGIGKAAEN